MPTDASGYYIQFLEAIDAGPHDVSDWEATFLDSMLAQRPAVFSPRQVSIVRRMAKQYLNEEVE